jgi:hypothetical protein
MCSTLCHYYLLLFVNFQLLDLCFIMFFVCLFFAMYFCFLFCVFCFCIVYLLFCVLVCVFLCVFCDFFCFVLCNLCIVLFFCVLFLLLWCLFPTFVPVDRPLPLGGNPVAVNKYHIIYLCDVRLSRMIMKDPVSWDVKVNSLVKVFRESSMTLEFSTRLHGGEECGSSAFHRECD